MDERLACLTSPRDSCRTSPLQTETSAGAASGGKSQGTCQAKPIPVSSPGPLSGSPHSCPQPGSCPYWGPQQRGVVPARPQSGTRDYRGVKKKKPTNFFFLNGDYAKINQEKQSPSCQRRHGSREQLSSAPAHATGINTF